MYKIFYQDRVIFLTDDFVSAFKNNYGLFYKYYDRKELQDLLKLFGYLTKIKKLYIFHDNLEHLFAEFTTMFTHVRAAGGLVRSHSGNVLVFNRRGKWDLPKGKIDKGESEEETAVREISEECGIHDLALGALITRTYHTYFDKGKPYLKETAWYHVNFSGDEESVVPQTQEDITEIIWLPPDELTMILGNTWLSVIDVLREARLLAF